MEYQVSVFLDGQQIHILKICVNQTHVALTDVLGATNWPTKQTKMTKMQPFLLPNLFMDSDVLSLFHYVTLSSMWLSFFIIPVYNMIQRKQKKCRYLFQKV